MANNKRSKAKKKKNNKFLQIFAILLIIVVGIGSFFVYSSFNLYKNGGVSNNSNGGYFEIFEGQNLKTISNNLKSFGIIKSPIFFTLKCENLGIDTNFKPGEFEIPPNADFNKIIEILQKNQGNSKNEVKFLIKEGDTQEDIAKNLEKQEIISYNEFMQACNTLDFSYDFLNDLPKSKDRTSKLEGYLYPDTYFIKKGESAESIINKFLKRFDELYTKDLKQATIEKGLSIDEVVTIASIIEKEIKYAPERKIAASVIFNRLKSKMPLQMDATVLYAKKQHSDRVLEQDTKIESPYNTYYVKGLPIGPISNPRIECIEAVLYPENTDYLYYVVKNDETGEHFYTADYNEFLKAKKQYIKKFDN